MLFRMGSRLTEYPLRMVWHSLSPEQLKSNFRDNIPDLIGPVQVLVSVPKKMRRRAVDRVRMRRRIREAFRLSRKPLLDKLAEMPEIRTLSIGLIYQKDADLEYDEIKIRVDKLMGKLISRLDALKETTTENTADEPSVETDC